MRRLAWGFVALLGGCVEELPVEMPTPPDLSVLLEAWEGPTADLGDNTAASIASNAAGKLGMADGLGACDDGGACSGPSVLTGTLGALGGSGSGTAALSPGVEQRRDALNIAGTEITGEGFVRIRRECKEWSAGKPGEKALTLTATFSDSGIHPVIWGQFADCRLPSGASELFLDASVHLHAGENLQLDRVEQSPLLFQVLGELAQGDADPTDLDLDFRVSPEDGFEVRVPAGDGHLFLFVREGEVGFRAANGEWSCQFGDDEHSSGTCGKRDGEEVSW